MSIHWHHLRRVPARTAMAVLVVAAHGLVLWMFWRVRTPVDAEVETFTSVLFFVPAPSPSQGARQPTKVSADRPSRAAASVPRARVALQPQTDASTAITLSAPPAAGVDWSAQLSDAAKATLENEKSR